MITRTMCGAALATALVACGDSQPLGDPLCGREETRTFFVHQRPALDVLVVLDRTPSMADQQPHLASNARALATLWEQAYGGLPDLHVAVVSSDLGATGVPGCGPGDGAAFLGGARCGLDDAYLAIRGLTAGGTRQNFDGALGDALACLLDLPLSTCPVSQPLGAAARALDGSVAGNAGFRRDGVPLAVVTLTDGDDCTLTAADALAGVTGATAAEVEAAVDFACFARGARCTPADPAAPGLHTDCAARADAGLADPAALVAALDGLTGLVVVRGGEDAEVVAGPRLAPTCTGNLGAGPAPRLAVAGGAAGARSVSTSACQADWTDALGVLATFTRTLEIPCLGATVDLDPETPGYQLSCAMRLASGGVTVAPLPPCDAPGVTPAQACLEPPVEDTEACPGGAEVHLRPGDQLLPGNTMAELRCEVPCE